MTAKFKDIKGELFFASPVEALQRLAASQLESLSPKVFLPKPAFYTYRATTEGGTLQELIDILEHDLKKLKQDFDIDKISL